MIFIKEILGVLHHAHRNVIIAEGEGCRHVTEVTVNDLHTQMENVVKPKGCRGRAIIHKAVGRADTTVLIRIPKLRELPKNVFAKPEGNHLVTLCVWHPLVFAYG